MNRIDKLLHRCTDPDIAVLEKPSLEGKNVIATNKHIAIVAPVDAVEGKYSKVANFPDVERALSKEYESFSITLDQIRVLLDSVPERPKRIECDECEGVGESICECCGQDVECSYCGTDGYTEHETEVEKDPLYPIRIKGRHISHKYLIEVFQFWEATKQNPECSFSRDSYIGTFRFDFDKISIYVAELLPHN